MVFYYTIRGGQCLNQHSHIILKSEDIICYVGRDKHENEYLIKYGWPGDIWFHVDSLSSAHVYFRIKNIDEVSSIPIDDLPPDSVADMMQICKNNSISGCKLASCKMVYTPHSNLKKTFDMESGAVTYHNPKNCRYARCEKDRTRVRELEKTKTADIKVDYFQEMKDNERRIIERKKRMRKEQLQNNNNVDDEMLHDPILDDLKSSKMKVGRQGDTSSGLDAGLEALEGISFGMSTTTTAAAAKDENGQESNTADKRPLWVQEEERRGWEPLKNVRFLRERGYSSSEAMAVCGTGNMSRISALRQLYNPMPTGGKEAASLDVVDVPEEVVQARMEEKEVLLAMFGFVDDDDEAAAEFSNTEDENILDVVLPITAYEPPERYDSPPQLMLEVYVDNNIAPLYPNEPPVLAVVGGGLPEARLKELTKRIHDEALEKVIEDPGEPQIFNLIAFIGEEAGKIVQEESVELEEIRQKVLETEKAAAAEARREAQKHTKSVDASFTSEAERRAYAREVAAKAATGHPVGKDDDKKKKTSAPKYYAESGVNDRDLCKDLFS